MPDTFVARPIEFPVQNRVVWQLYRLDDFVGLIYLVAHLWRAGMPAASTLTKGVLYRQGLLSNYAISVAIEDSDFRCKVCSVNLHRAFALEDMV